MKRCDIIPGRFFFLLALALPLAGVGCATSGSANATGESSTARTGDATQTTTVSLALGDKVAEAAKDAVLAVMNPGMGMGTAAEQETRKKEAVEKGVDAGKKQAEAEGKKVTEKDEKELRKLAQKAADDAEKSKGGGDQAPAK